MSLCMCGEQYIEGGGICFPPFPFIPGTKFFAIPFPSQITHYQKKLQKIGLYIYSNCSLKNVTADCLCFKCSHIVHSRTITHLKANKRNVPRAILELFEEKC